MPQLMTRVRRYGTRLYGFSGGMRVGARGGSFLTMQRLWPGELWSVEGVSTSIARSLLSLQQIFALNNLPWMLQHGPLGEAILGGWSFGVNDVQDTVAVLEASASSVRAVFALDPRTSRPQRIQIRDPQMEDATYVEKHWFKESIQQNAGNTDRFNVLLRTTGVPRSRCHHQTYWFVAPYFLWSSAYFIPDDDNVSDRRDTFFTVVDTYSNQTSNHFLIGIDRAWDVARRLRLGAAPRGRAARGAR